MNKLMKVLVTIGCISMFAGILFNVAEVERVWQILGVIGALCFGTVVVVGFIDMVKNEWR